MAHAFGARKRPAPFRCNLHTISFSFDFHFPVSGSSRENVTGHQLGAWLGWGRTQCG